MEIDDINNLETANQLSTIELEKIELIRKNPIYMESIYNMQSIATKLFPSIQIIEEEMLIILASAFIEKDDNYTLQEAIEWGNEYQIPDEILAENSRLFRECNYDLSLLARTIQNRFLKDRFNEQRVNDWDPTDPLLPLLQWMVKDGGSPVIFDDDFIPNYLLGIPNMRHIYEHGAHSAVDKSIMKQCDNGICVVLPESDWIHLPEDSHSSPESWTTNSGKPQGRPLVDLSNQPSGGGMSINSDALKAKCIEFFGAIEYPNIIDYVYIMWEQGEIHGFDNLIFYKNDIVAAYTQVYIHPDFVKYLCTRITNGISINLAMVFGGVQFPYEMNVITRCCQRKYDKLLKGRSLMYSDDTGHCCHVKDLEHDKACIKEILTSLMGPKCIESDPNKSKDREGRFMEFIGYQIDLDNQLIALSRRNGNKTLYAFFSIDLKAVCDAKEMQKLASLAERTTLIFNMMKPFVQELHNFGAYASRVGHPMYLSGGAKFVISLWRLILILMNLKPFIFTAKLESFIFKLSRIAIKHDACPTGISFAIYEIINGEHHNLNLNWFCGADIRRFRMKGDSSCQNTVEFISMTMGLIVLATLGVRNTPIFVIGDSTTSLSWAKSGKFKSVLCQRAAVLFATLGFYSKNYINETLLILGINNSNEDAMSRLFEDSPSQIPADYLPYPNKRIFIENDILLERCLNWCNPNLPPLFLDNGSMSCMDEFCEINAMIISICK